MKDMWMKESSEKPIFYVTYTLHLHVGQIYNSPLLFILTEKKASQPGGTFNENKVVALRSFIHKHTYVCVYTLWLQKPDSLI